MRVEFLTVLLGSALALTGLYYLLTDFLYGDPSIDWYVSNIILLAGGIATAVFTRKNLVNATILSMYTIGITMIITYAPDVLDTDDSVEMVFATVYLLLAIVLIYYATSLVLGTSAGSMKAIICLCVMLFFELSIPIYEIYTGTNPASVFEEYRDQIVDGTMHIVVVIILTRKNMLLESSEKRAYHNSLYLSDAMFTAPNTYLDREMVPLITDNIGWHQLNEGPIEYEKTIPLRGTTSVIRMQRWKDSDQVYFGISTKGKSYEMPLVLPIRMIAKETKSDLITKLRIYGDDGVFVDLMVKDFDEEERKGYIETIRSNKRKKLRAKKIKEKLNSIQPPTIKIP